MKHLVIAANGKEIRIADEEDAKRIEASIDRSVSAKEEWTDLFETKDGVVFRVQIKHIAYIAWRKEDTG